MSLFKGENPVLGAATLEAELSGQGAGQPTLNYYKPTTREFLDLQANAVTITASQLDGWMFRAPWKCQIIAANAIAVTPATSSMTIQFYTVPVASQPEGPASGNQVLASALNLDSGLVANTVQALTLATTAANLILNPGDLLGFSASGAATGLVGGNIQVEIVQLG